MARGRGVGKGPVSAPVRRRVKRARHFRDARDFRHYFPDGSVAEASVFADEAAADHPQEGRSGRRHRRESVKSPLIAGAQAGQFVRLDWTSTSRTDGAPQVNHAPIDFQIDLVQMPDRMRFGTALPIPPL